MSGWLLDPNNAPPRWVEVSCAKPPENDPERRCRFALKPNGPAGNSWDWRMDPSGPTLTPSINCLGGCGWHGHIIDGERK